MNLNALENESKNMALIMKLAIKTMPLLNVSIDSYQFLILKSKYALEANIKRFSIALKLISRIRYDIFIWKKLNINQRKLRLD